MVAELQAGDDAFALECYREAFQRGSRSPIAIGGQLRILRRSADWPALLELLEETQDLVTSPGWKAALSWDRVRILSDHLDRAADAAELRETVIREQRFLPALWEKIAGLVEAGDLEAFLAARQDVPHGDALSPLESLMEAMYWARRGSPRLLEEATSAADDRWAFDVKELWQCEIGDLDALVDTYAERLEHTGDSDQARYLGLRIAAWLEVRERWEEAWRATADVVRAGTFDQVTLDRLERLAAAAGRLEELDAVLSEVSESAGAGVEPLLRAARHRERRLDDPERALEAYQVAWRDRPDAYEAMDGVARLADRLDLPEFAASACAARAATLSEPADQAADWLLAGERFARVDDDEKTEQAYGSVLEHGLLKRQAFDRLVRLYRTRADVDGLEIIHDRWIGRERDPVVRQCMVMGLADQLEALGALRPAVVHFERLAMSEQYLPASLRLERIHLASEDWPRYVAALQARIEAVQSEQAAEAARALALEVQAGKLQEPWAMEQILQRRLEQGDLDPETVEAYRVLLASQERWTDLTVFLEEQAAKAEQQDVKVRHLLDSGWIYANKLDDLDLATDRYQDILDLVEGDPEALAALVDISQRRQDWNGMVAALARKAVTLDDAGKIVAYREIARVWDEKLEDAETAVQAYRKVLDLRPDDAIALGALTDLHRRLRQWPEFVDIADRWLNVRRDEDPALLNEVGITLARRLDEPERAVPFLLRALARGQGDLEVLRGVAERFEARDQWLEAAELYERVAERVEDPDAVIDLYERTATICRERLDDTSRAVVAYEKLLEKAPDHLPAMWSLGKVYQEAGRRDDALKTLGDLIRHPSAHAYLEQLTDVERLEFHRQFGNLLSEAGFREEAAAHYQEALRIMPGHQELLENLAQLYRSMGWWDRYAEILQARIDTSPDLSRETLAERYEELGRAYRSAGNPDAALEAFWQAQDRAPKQAEVYLLMAEIYLEREDWNTLLGLYNSVIKYSPEPGQVADAYIRKGDILYNHLAPLDPSYVGKAVLHYEKAVTYDRRNTYAMLRLAEIALEGRKFQKAQEWLRWVLGVEPEGQTLARTLVLGGVLCAEALKDTDAALANFNKAATAWPDLAEHLDRLAGELSSAPGNLEQFLRLYRMFLPWTPSSPQPDAG